MKKINIVFYISACLFLISCGSNPSGPPDDVIKSVYFDRITYFEEFLIIGLSKELMVEELIIEERLACESISEKFQVLGITEIILVRYNDGHTVLTDHGEKENRNTIWVETWLNKNDEWEIDYDLEGTCPK